MLADGRGWPGMDEATLAGGQSKPSQAPMLDSTIQAYSLSSRILPAFAKWRHSTNKASIGVQSKLVQQGCRVRMGGPSSGPSCVQ